MNWNSEADAKLFTEILVQFDLKFTKEILASLAAAMGPDCTPKAISEHVRVIRNKVKGAGTSAPATPTKAAKTTPARGKKSTPKSKLASSVNDSPSDNEEVLPMTPTAAKAGKKRGRTTASLSPLLDEIRVAACDDEDKYEGGSVKRVKT